MTVYPAGGSPPERGAYEAEVWRAEPLDPNGDGAGDADRELRAFAQRERWADWAYVSGTPGARWARGFAGMWVARIRIER